MWVLVFSDVDVSSDVVFIFMRMNLFNNVLKLVSSSMLVSFVFVMVAPLIVVLHLGNLHVGVPLVILSMIILFESFVDVSKPKFGC